MALSIAGKNHRIRFKVLAWYYVVALLTSLIIHLVVGDRWWWLALWNTLMPYWYAPLLVVLPFSVATRNRILSGLCVTLALIFGLTFRYLFSLPHPAAISSQFTLRVMTYNIWVFNQQTSAIVDNVRQSGADVVGFQELNPATVSALRTQLGQLYPYQLLDSENGVISRYPLVIENLALDANWGPASPAKIYRIDAGRIPVVLIDSHHFSAVPAGDLSAMPQMLRERERQARAIVKFVSEVEGGSVPHLPTDALVVMTADFNAGDQSTVHRIISEKLIDSWQEAGHGLGHTWHLSLPGISTPWWFARIDYLFHSARAHAIDARVVPWDGASDHRAVVVDLAIRD